MHKLSWPASNAGNTGGGGLPHVADICFGSPASGRKEHSVSRCLLLVEFALATVKIALNEWNPTFLLPLISGIWVLLICGLDGCRWPSAT
jgi:hypothetical protein